MRQPVHFGVVERREKATIRPHRAEPRFHVIRRADTREAAVAKGEPITAHLATATVYLEPSASDRLERFPSLATEGKVRRRAQAELVDDAAWQAVLGGWPIVLDPDTTPPTLRFIERRHPPVPSESQLIERRTFNTLNVQFDS